MSVSNHIAGGQIVDIIRNDNDTVTIRGFVQSADPYAANSTLVEMSSKACGLQPACTAIAEAPVAPSCSMYPVDMSFCGMEGLMTDRSAQYPLLEESHWADPLNNQDAFSGEKCHFRNSAYDRIIKPAVGMHRDNAVLVISCSDAVSGLCYPEVQQCMYVDGPVNTTVAYVSEVNAGPAVYYHMQVSWEVGATI